MTEKLAVIKRDPQGRQTWRYEGHVLERSGTRLVLEAFFDRDDFPYMGTTLKRGDRFVETYFSDRWYNIFEIYDRDDHKLKGIYCNITTPARFPEERVEYEDLFLDVWVDLEGHQTVLDRDEFDAAELDDATRQAALQALEELQEYLREHKNLP
jgi:predicted RNA-binding protein associated with RNAse of E/G family